MVQMLREADILTRRIAVEVLKEAFFKKKNLVNFSQ